MTPEMVNEDLIGTLKRTGYSEMDFLGMDVYMSKELMKYNVANVLPRLNPKRLMKAFLYSKSSRSLQKLSEKEKDAKYVITNMSKLLMMTVLGGYETDVVRDLIPSIHIALASKVTDLD